MLGAGIEPARAEAQGILSPLIWCKHQQRARPFRGTKCKHDNAKEAPRPPSPPLLGQSAIPASVNTDIHSSFTGHPDLEDLKHLLDRCQGTAKVRIAIATVRARICAVILTSVAFCVSQSRR